MAPPDTLVISGGNRSARITASACAANASFASISSSCSTLRPARVSALATAAIGPVPMMAGSTPADAYARTRASGVTPSRSARSAPISTTAAAPSLRPDALPAVTVPSFLNAGRIATITSADGRVRGYSSVSKTNGRPFFCAISSGTISSVKCPASTAASARRTLSDASAS